MKRASHPVRSIMLIGLLSLILTNCIWQFGEIQLYRNVPGIIYKLTGLPIATIRSFDEDGVRTVVYADNSIQYNPLFIARQANTDFQNLGDPESKRRFLAATDWLYDNATVIDSIALYKYDFAMPRYNLAPGWHSALAQAVILEALYSRYQLDNDSKWQDLSHKVLNSLAPGPGGLCVELTPDAYWYDEYPTDPPSFVLNGMNSVLEQLHLYHQASGDSLAMLLFDRGYAGLLLRLPSYDKGGYTYHDGTGTPTSRSYHWMHYHQMKMLDEIRPHPLLKHYHKRWRANYYLVPVFIQLIINFNAKRAVTFAASWIVIFVLILLAYMLWKRLRSHKYKS